MYLQTSHSSCKLEIYIYNLQSVGVFQKARSKNNIQAEACNYIIAYFLCISIAVGKQSCNFMCFVI